MIGSIKKSDNTNVNIMMSICRKRLSTLLFLFIFIIFLILYWSLLSDNSISSTKRSNSRETITYHDGKMYTYTNLSPLIFIGGFPRSGTTLIRAMLDAHKDVRCGEETRVVPRILQLATQWNKSAKESNRLKEAGLSDDILGSAVSSFILEVVVKHGEPAARLCNKDPFTLKYGVYLLNLFPSSKFIFMIRDGRAVVHSLISRKVTVTGFDLTSYRQCLTKWSNSMRTMEAQCAELGESKCLRVKYEELVKEPEREMRRILEYLGIEWAEEVLHHEDFIGKPGGVSLSKVERSSDQVVKPVYKEALNKWVGAIPQDVLDDMDTIAPMLKILGYD